MIPFFPPDLFEEDRATLHELLHELGTSAEQKFILGARVAELEAKVVAETGARHAVACSSGTGGLELCVAALGIGPGDEVIVPAFCCQPVASSVVNAGAVPIFVDVDPWTMVMDPDAAEAAITERTKALMPAHLFSIMADMPRYREIADRHGLALIEDAAVAQGAVLGEVPAGRWGELGVFSFFQVKAMGTIGEGGIVLTDDADLAAAVRMHRNHGQDGVTRFMHHVVGQNKRLDELVASFQLARWDGFAARLERRARIADYYTERFAGLAEHGIQAPPPGRDGRCYYVYSLQVRRREDLRAWLTSRDIGSHVYYPVPLPEQPAFEAFAPEYPLPHSRHASSTNLAIPIWPHLSDTQVEYIADTVCEFVS
ncbi:DegT/DnrJ/EryC1/StrS family aminotransferase [Nocardia cyriacigeorgica]|uniref:DegT/DnrJ/EryC1/StrS family aminotransferase n=1 Tax=Nocardia cyriacigeorgica TaxID=135487 RepID=UPI001894CD79|nr:DegT/DnrJ/EryC1/StrS family aminotransferase [Nocardia cyriacigeorgica]MBF6436585.1 DegT/DnrJ/EryC1/StrS family aminotransferase [Nocardia cyriacigeorgica]MBF6452154.1 DegT/DnrJ/EryC1/StrS family aminotransferase [Nocardia cyriacigeorgica]MBF6477505.1 DegT/DnrJ/EryC1/StrS family aminotransferase [Nocardia cyriacigeorgica]MBF6549323.1 DegT/DnrJ/EryC1/StrS family aminotransferase [Nocardia cyriacigeorgica]